MAQVRAAIGDRTDTVVLFELPDVLRVLRDAAFWDVYYEHCSYFSPGSLARLFRLTGFEVLRLEMDYDDQYILLEAKPVPAGAPGFTNRTVGASRGVRAGATTNDLPAGTAERDAFARPAPVIH